MAVNRWLPENPTKPSLTKLPNDLAFYCLSFLEDNERYKISETCHNFREAFIKLTTGKLSWKTHAIAIRLASKGHRFPAVCRLRPTQSLAELLYCLDEEHFPRLERLDLRGVHLDQLPRHLGVTKLRACGCNFNPEGGIFPYPNLKTLKIQGGDFKALPELHELEDFHVDPAALLLTNLHNHSHVKLKKLTLKSMENASKLFVEPMALVALDESTVPSLEELHIQDPELAFLPAHSKLKTISIDTARSRLDLSQLTPEKFPAMTSLRLVRATCSSLFLEMLPHNENLESLFVRHGTSLKGINTVNFPNLKNIKTF